MRRRLRLRIGFLRVVPVGFVMADDASGHYTDLAMPSHVARDAANDSTLDTSLRRGGGSEHDAQNGGPKDQRLHGGSPEKPVAATIRRAAIGSGKGLSFSVGASDPRIDI